MAIYVCPICDKRMKSRHFCINCRSYIKEPFVCEVTYYLNERHPDNEKSCVYHQGDERHGRMPDSRRISVPNQPSTASMASLNGAGQTETVPNQPHAFNQAGDSVYQQATIPNQPRKTMAEPSASPENMERYLRTMKELGRNGLQTAAEKMKDYQETASQRYGTGQDDKKKETKKMSALAMVILFILFVNIFADVIIPFLRYVMYSIF